MTEYRRPLILAAALIAIALLAVFDVVPEAVAQYAPLALFPFLIRKRDTRCAKAGC